MFKIRDEVWDVRYGDGIVQNIRTRGALAAYPIVVNFGNDKVQSYTEEGKSSVSDTYPSLFYKGTALIPAPEPDRNLFRRGQKVFDPHFGDGTVTKIDHHDEYPVYVAFPGNDAEEEYTLDGQYHHECGRTLFPIETKPSYMDWLMGVEMYESGIKCSKP